MTLRLSTGLRNAMLDEFAVAANLMTGTTISFRDGTGTDSRDRIADSGNGLAGFTLGDKVTVAASTSNNVTAEILAVAAGYLEVAAGTLSTEAAGEQVVLASASGGSFVDLFRNGVLDIYSGSQPTGSDSAETGTKLVSITLSSGAFVGGTATNGINLGEVSSGVLAKESGETWSGTAVATGVAGWFRFYDNSYTAGASTSAVRFDGAVATSGSQLNMSNTSITTGGSTTIDSLALTQPAA